MAVAISAGQAVRRFVMASLPEILFSAALWARGFSLTPMHWRQKHQIAAL
jgi:hypothetical protein